jgi:hypothetical protein
MYHRVKIERSPMMIFGHLVKPGVAQLVREGPIVLHGNPNSVYQVTLIGPGHVNEARIARLPVPREHSRVGWG